MVKEGQIYLCKRRGLLLITRVHKISDKRQGFYLLWKNGVCSYEARTLFLAKKPFLVEEYSTWQEAVNSEEFNQRKIK